ncbi:MAG: hypothetical protein LBM93_07425 [Oscillospiraceae bacterium]|jgi:hypothetical protein|nr:hypothetical protein [Oscillospiraceae bacterium]
MKKEKETVNNEISESQNTVIAETLQDSQAELESKIKGIYSDYKEKNRAVRKFDRKLYTTIGIIIIIMAIAGVFWTVFNSVIWINKLLKPDESKYLNLIEPTVIADTPSFENISELNDTTKITFAVWDILLHSNLDIYDKSFDVVFVPQSDIEQSLTKMFGDCPVTHKTITIGQYTILFNEVKKHYVIPTKPDYFSYYPSIKKVYENKEDGYTTVTVALYADIPSWQKDLERVQTSAVKYMKYTIIKNKITKIENVSSKYGIFNI